MSWRLSPPVLPAGLDTRGGAMNIGQAEIREIQIELNRMGFNVGEPDGRLGPRTKEALMAFQHQKGFNATGEIDRETFAALRSEGGQQGNEGKAVEGERGNQPATTGQGGDQRQPSSNQQQPSNEPRANQQQKGSERQSGSNEPQGAGAPANAGRPSTTGQSSPGAGANNPPNANTSGSSRERRNNQQR